MTTEKLGWPSRKYEHFSTAQVSPRHTNSMGAYLLSSGVDAELLPWLLSLLEVVSSSGVKLVRFFEFLG